MHSLHHCGFLFQEFSWFDLLLQVCASGSSLRGAVLTRLGAGSKMQGSSRKIPYPRKKSNQEFKNRCDADRAARGQGLSSPSSSNGTISESPAQGDLEVKDAANFGCSQGPKWVMDAVPPCPPHLYSPHKPHVPLAAFSVIRSQFHVRH